MIFTSEPSNFYDRPAQGPIRPYFEIQLQSVQLQKHGKGGSGSKEQTEVYTLKEGASHSTGESLLFLVQIFCCLSFSVFRKPTASYFDLSNSRSTENWLPKYGALKVEGSQFREGHNWFPKHET